jgi:hypothetical protein
MFLELLLFVNYSQMRRGCISKQQVEFLHSRFCAYFPDFDNLFREGSRIYAQICVGGSRQTTRRLRNISKLFAMSQIIMRSFFGRCHHAYYVRVNLHLIYWMNKPIIELISRFNDPRFHDFKPKWGARMRLLPAPSSPYSRIDIIEPREDFRLQNAGLNFYMRLQCLGSSPITSPELQILIHWAIEAENEFRGSDAYMFGSSYPMMSAMTWKNYSCGKILDLLKESDILSRVLRLFLRQKRQLLRQ